MRRKVMVGRDFCQGRFVGPFRVLATETKSDGDMLQPRKCVWLYRGNRLTRAALQQLRAATVREEAWNELVDPRKEIPWTTHRILNDTNRRVFDDALPEAADMPDDVDGEEDEQERDVVPSRHRVRGKQPGRQRGNAAPRSRSPRASGRADRRPVEPRPKQPRQDVGAAVKEPEFSLSPSSFWEDQDAAVSVAIDLPGWNSSQRREMFRDMEAFVVRQIKRQNVEVSEKRMTPEEKEQLKGAKMKEVTNYIS